MVGDSNLVKQAMQLSNAGIDLLGEEAGIHGLYSYSARARECGGVFVVDGGKRKGKYRRATPCKNGSVAGGRAEVGDVVFEEEKNRVYLQSARKGLPVGLCLQECKKGRERG